MMNVGFREDLEQEQVGTLALRDPAVVQAETSLRSTVEDMRAKSIGCAVIVDDSQAPIGIFTERSVIELLAMGEPLDERPVGNCREPSFISVHSSDPISRVWDAIQRSGARFVCVIDDEGKLKGITGQRGLAEYLAECFARQVTAQRLGSTPWTQQREGA